MQRPDIAGPVLLGLGLLLLQADIARGRGRELMGDKPLPGDQERARGVEGMLNVPGRVYWSDVNGDEHAFWRVDSAAVNLLLTHFANVQAPRHELLVRPGPGRVRTFGGAEHPANLELHLPGGLYAAVAKREAGTRVYFTDPTVILYVGADGPALRDLKVPPGLQVVTSQDLGSRYLAGLKSADPKVRKQAVVGLGAVARDVPEAVPTLMNGLGDPNQDVRTQAASTLGSLGAQASDALPALRRALADESAGVRQAAQSAVQAVTESEKPDPVLENLRQAVCKEIEAFAQPHRTRTRTPAAE